MILTLDLVGKNNNTISISFIKLLFKQCKNQAQMHLIDRFGWVFKNSYLYRNRCFVIRVYKLLKYKVY